VHTLGLRVVINGSRAHVPKLTEVCPKAEIVEVTASEPVIRQRRAPAAAKAKPPSKPDCTATAP
jgi:ribose 1,5-bisphosphokinase PhnN